MLAAVRILLFAGMAGYFAWRQWQTLRTLRAHRELSAEDRRYSRRQVWRRLTGCLLMIVLASQLSGWYMLDMEGRAKAALHEKGAADETPAQAVLRGAAQQRFINFFTFYWIFTILVLLAIVAVVALDVVAIRRFGLRHYRQIQFDRRAMIEREVAQMRGQRNGHP